MAMKGYSTFQNLQDWIRTIRGFSVISRTLVSGGSFLYNSKSLGNKLKYFHTYWEFKSSLFSRNRHFPPILSLTLYQWMVEYVMFHGWISIPSRASWFQHRTASETCTSSISLLPLHPRTLGKEIVVPLRVQYMDEIISFLSFFDIHSLSNSIS